MKTEVRKINDNKREINIEVSGERVTNKFNEVFEKIGKEAKVPGFRPGHVPRDMLEKRFSSHAHEQVLKELIPDLYNEAIEKEKLDVVELPEISDVKLDRSSLSFKAQVEISPEIKLKKYKGIKLKYKNIAVTEDEVKRFLDSLKESRKLDTIDDGFARGLGYPDLEELKKALERQLMLQKDNANRKAMEDEIIDNLLKSVDFKPPRSIVNRQLQDLLRQAKVDLALKGVPKEKIEQEEAAFSKELEPEAEKQVRIYLILSHIAKIENIAIDDHMPRRVMEFLLKEAEWSRDNEITPATIHGGSAKDDGGKQ